MTRPMSAKKIISLIAFLIVTVLTAKAQLDTNTAPSSTSPNSHALHIEQDDSPNGVIVSRVIDGDTIQLETGDTVRYIGIDTPETVSPRKAIQCFGHEASKKNKELVEGKRVHLQKDVSQTDRYGRLLRYVYLNDVLVNDYLVQQGYAYASSFPPDIAKQDQFRASQTMAREGKIGLWQSCPAR